MPNPFAAKIAAPLGTGKLGSSEARKLGCVAIVRRLNSAHFAGQLLMEIHFILRVTCWPAAAISAHPAGSAYLAEEPPLLLRLLPPVARLQVSQRRLRADWQPGCQALVVTEPPSPWHMACMQRRRRRQSPGHGHSHRIAATIVVSGRCQAAAS